MRQIEQKGGRAAAMVMDTSRPSDAKALVELALIQYGSLDVLVNNAGIDAPRGTIWGLTDEEWQRTIDVNLSGVFYCTRAALKPMLAAGSGCIVNISSQAARAAGDPNGSPAYNASKAGLIGLTIAHVYFAARPEKWWITKAMIVGWVTRRQYLQNHDPNRWRVGPGNMR